MTAALDLAGCHELHIQCGLYEHERAGVTADRATWPVEAERRIARELVAWQTRNPFREVRCAQTSAIEGRVTLSIWHGPPRSPIRGAAA